MKKLTLTTLLVTGSCMAMEAHQKEGMENISEANESHLASSPACEMEIFFRDLKEQNPELQFSHRKAEEEMKRRYDNDGKMTIFSVHTRGGISIFILPESICGLANLTEIDIRRQHFMSLPKDFGRLINLRNLSLPNNKLTQLPESISNITTLTSLSLSNNLLEDLPFSFGNLTNLTYLNLSGNPLRPERTRVYPHDRVYLHDTCEFTAEEIAFMGGIRMPQYGFSQREINILLKNCRERAETFFQ